MSIVLRVEMELYGTRCENVSAWDVNINLYVSKIKSL